MLNKQSIENLMTLFASGDNADMKWVDADKASVKRSFLMGKCIIDRWNIISSDLFLHPIHKEKVKLALGSEDKVWGMNIAYSTEMPLDKGIMLAMTDDGDWQDEEHIDRCIAVIHLDAL